MKEKAPQEQKNNKVGFSIQKINGEVCIDGVPASKLLEVSDWLLSLLDQVPIPIPEQQ